MKSNVTKIGDETHQFKNQVMIAKDNIKAFYTKLETQDFERVYQFMRQTNDLIFVRG